MVENGLDPGSSVVEVHFANTAIVDEAFLKILDLRLLIATRECPVIQPWVRK
jgi:hypothetical protein